MTVSGRDPGFIAWALGLTDDEEAALRSADEISSVDRGDRFRALTLELNRVGAEAYSLLRAENPRDEAAFRELWRHRNRLIASFLLGDEIPLRSRCLASGLDPSQCEQLASSIVLAWRVELGIDSAMTPAGRVDVIKILYQASRELPESSLETSIALGQLVSDNALLIWQLRHLAEQLRVRVGQDSFALQVGAPTMDAAEFNARRRSSLRPAAATERRLASAQRELLAAAMAILPSDLAARTRRSFLSESYGAMGIDPLEDSALLEQLTLTMPESIRAEAMSVIEEDRRSRERSHERFLATADAVATRFAESFSRPPEDSDRLWSAYEQWQSEAAAATLATIGALRALAPEWIASEAIQSGLKARSNRVASIQRMQQTELRMFAPRVDR